MVFPIRSIHKCSVEWMAGQAVSTAVSPDGNTLLVLTSGYNRVFQGAFPIFDPLYSSEYIFIFGHHESRTGLYASRSPSPMPITELSGIRFRATTRFMSRVAWRRTLRHRPDSVHQAEQWNNVTSSRSNQTEAGEIPPNLTWAKALPLLFLAIHRERSSGANNQFASVNASFRSTMAAGIAISGDGQTLVWRIISMTRLRSLPELERLVNPMGGRPDRSAARARRILRDAGS